MTTLRENQQVSDHFNEWEFRSHDGMLPTVVNGELIVRLETLRALKGGRPLPIVSGYRSHQHNRAVGGVRSSRHLLGEAADIPEEYATTEEAEEAGFRGIGSVRGWAVHVDVRPTPARWEY